MTFSKRMGIVPEKKPLQLNDMDEELRVELHNDIRLFEESIGGDHHIKPVYKLIWSHFYNKTIDDFDDGHYWYKSKKELISLFDSLKWHGVYDYIEVYLRLISVRRSVWEVNPLRKNLVLTLEKHNSGYRLLEDKFVPITNDTVLEELSQAANTGLKAVNHHMKQAIAIFSQKESKDYRNVIKEAMSAVEATVNHVNGTKGKTLGDALKQLDQKRHIHEAMKSAFDKLYGYTSDTNSGIRHGLTDDADSIPGFAEAKFMIVACSAFINWLQCREAE